MATKKKTEEVKSDTKRKTTRKKTDSAKPLKENKAAVQKQDKEDVLSAESSAYEVGGGLQSSVSEVSDVIQNVELAATGEDVNGTEEDKQISSLVHKPAKKEFLSGKCVVELKDLHFNYGDERVIRGISEKIYERESYAILGASGCGKSTLLRIMAGLMYPSKGDIIVHDVDLVKATKVELMGIHQYNSFIFQTGALIQNMRVFDNIALPLRYHNPDMTEAEIRERVDDILVKLNLQEDAQHLPSQISQGEVKLAAFARALISGPRLMYMDEPMAGLDHRTQIIIRDLIMEMKKQGITLILVTNNTRIAFDVADRIALLRDGIIYICDYPDSIKNINDTYLREIIGLV